MEGVAADARAEQSLRRADPRGGRSLPSVRRLPLPLLSRGSLQPRYLGSSPRRWLQAGRGRGRRSGGRRDRRQVSGGPPDRPVHAVAPAALLLLLALGLTPGARGGQQAAGPAAAAAVSDRAVEQE